MLGADGLVHWTAPGRLTAGRRVQPHVSDHAYWITRTSLHAEPEAQRIDAPPIREGRPSLVGALPDGSSWWQSNCSDWDPPSTVACYSLLRVGPEGQPLGRVSSPRWGTLYLEADGTLLSLEVASAPEPDTRGNPMNRPPPQRRLQLWRGTPLALEAFDQPADNAWWDDDYGRRMARLPRDGWELVWEVPFPISYRNNVDRAIWTLSPTTRHDRDGALVAAVVGTGERFVAGVFMIEVGSSSAARLETVWQRDFPRARNALSEDEDGNFALASPWSIALSSRGELAMGRWQINADCSTDRPPGFVVLDDEGEVLADVRGDEETWQSRVEGLTFDHEDRLVVATWGDTVTYTARGESLDTAPRTPTVWQHENEQLVERARALTASSPLSEWVDLYPVLLQLHDDEGGPDSERQALAARLLVEGWPSIEPRLSDEVWLELAGRICATHPEAAQVALRRFEAAWGEYQIRWLEALPTCFDAPPPSAIALARKWLELRDSQKREAARSALSRWPAPVGMVDELWTAAVAAASSSDHRVRYEATQRYAQLLATIVQHRDGFETRLRAGGDERSAAIAVLFSSFERFGTGYVSPENAPLRAALLESARVWERSDDESLRAVGGLLLLGHGAWSGAPRVERATVGEEARSRQAPAPAIGSEPGHIDRLLMGALGGAAHPDPDLPLWATIAVSRWLEQRATRSPGSDALAIPSLDELGLRTELVMALFATATADLDAARQSGRPQLAPYNQLEQARYLVLRSLGEPGQGMLLQELRGFEGASDPRMNTRLWELTTWMAEDLARWEEADVRFVLGALHRDPNAAGWQSAAILDAVARAYPADHELHRMARVMFRSYIDEAVELAGDPRASSNHPGNPQRRVLLSQMVFRLQHGDPPPNEPSPLLAELTVADVEALAGSDFRSGFESWLRLMEITGPWPAAVPELERMLEGDSRVGVQAAAVLSHLEHERALEVLLDHAAYGDELSALARALARYGAAGVEPLLERVARPVDDTDPRSRYSLQNASRQSASRLLTQLAVAHPDLVRQLKGERLAAARASLSASVDAALERGSWPDGSAVVLVDTLDGGLDTARSRQGVDNAQQRSGVERPEIGTALGRVLVALDRLPKDAGSARAFLFGQGTQFSADLLRRLGVLARDGEHPLHAAALALVEPLADEGVEGARWVVQQAEIRR